MGGGPEGVPRCLRPQNLKGSGGGEDGTAPVLMQPLCFCFHIGKIIGRAKRNVEMDIYLSAHTPGGSDTVQQGCAI